MIFWWRHTIKTCQLSLFERSYSFSFIPPFLPPYDFLKNSVCACKATGVGKHGHFRLSCLSSPYSFQVIGTSLSRTSVRFQGGIYLRFVDIWSRVRSVFPEPMGADPLSITPMRNTKEKKKFDLKTASGSWSFKFNVPLHTVKSRDSAMALPFSRKLFCNDWKCIYM